MINKNTKIRKRLRKNKRKKLIYTYFLGLIMVFSASKSVNGRGVINCRNIDISFKQENEAEACVNVDIDVKDEINKYFNEYYASKKKNKAKLKKLMGGISKEMYLDVLYNREPEVSETPDYGFPVNPEYQEYIRKMADRYEVPFEIVMVIFDQESNGCWNNNGKISPTNDYGVPQINAKTIDRLITPNLGYSREEVQYDPYKGAESGIYVIKYIWSFLGYDIHNFNYYNTFGSYNGWIDFKTNPDCVKYANTCMKRLEQHFGITNEKTASTSLKR